MKPTKSNCRDWRWSNVSYLSNRSHFVGVYKHTKPTQGNKRTQEEACKAKIDGNKFPYFFSCSPKHSPWVYYAGKPIKIAVFCIYKTLIIGSSSKELHEKVLFLFYNDQGLSSLYIMQSVIANDKSTSYWFNE